VYNVTNETSVATVTPTNLFSGIQGPNLLVLANGSIGLQSAVSSGTQINVSNNSNGFGGQLIMIAGASSFLTVTGGGYTNSLILVETSANASRSVNLVNGNSVALVSNSSLIYVQGRASGSLALGDVNNSGIGFFKTYLGMPGGNIVLA